MGEIIRYECTCGYQSAALRLGSGMEDFRVASNARPAWPSVADFELNLRESIPVRCSKCREIVAVSNTAASTSCPECSTTIALSTNVLHPAVSPECPRCGATNLHLTEIGSWD